MTPTLTDAGAHYFKVDLQVHTPRDRGWEGERPENEDARKQYAAAFVNACRARALRAVAITDHHDFAFVEYIRAAAREERTDDGDFFPAERRLVVYPGVELSLGVPCQALMILDADFPSERLSDVLKILAIPEGDTSLPLHDQPSQLKFTELSDLHEHLDRSEWLNGRYIVLPNVTDSGHGTLMRHGMQQKYATMPCVGGYVDGSIAKTGDGNLRKFAGRDVAWGNKRIAVVQTSDSRSATFDGLGRHATWIKWAAPTAEALRQACLALESRIAHSEPGLPSVVITRLRVTNSLFMGPIDLDLNPQYNVLIGGRGTGKSSCLEYLRWALCEEPQLHVRDAEIPDLPGRTERLIDQTLAPYEAQVEVSFLLNGIPHMVRRYAADGQVMLKVGDHELRSAAPDDIRSLLPIEAYSQRQLSSVAVRLDELMRFIRRPIREQLDDIADRERELAIEIRENHAKLERQRILEKDITKDRLAVESLAERTRSVREGLTGLGEEDRSCLADKPRYERAVELAGTWRRKLDQADEEAQRATAFMRELLSGLKQSAPKGFPEQATLEALHSEGVELMSEVLQSIEAAAQSLTAQRADGTRLTELSSRWQVAYDDYTARYDAAAARSTAHASRLEELKALEQRQRDLQEQLTVHQEELSALGDPAARHGDLLGRWRSAQEERSQVIEHQCEHLTELSSGAIRASLKRGIGTSRLQERFKAAIVGSGLRSAKIDAFLERVAASEDPLTVWHSAMAELEALIVQWRDEEELAACSSALRTFQDKDIERILGKIDASAVLELSLIPLDDEPVFEYRTKEAEHIAFNDASAGQQATALLHALLNQAGPPLLIDQPEDDLDSDAVMEIVDQIWTAKHRRQLLFASHSANLVVNGDAELVVHCDYRAAGDHSAGHIECQGAIDIPQVREKITAVMEGGEKAFRLRKEKYGF